MKSKIESVVRPSSVRVWHRLSLNLYLMDFFQKILFLSSPGRFLNYKKQKKFLIFLRIFFLCSLTWDPDIRNGTLILEIHFLILNIHFRILVIHFLILKNTIFSNIRNLFSNIRNSALP